MLHGHSARDSLVWLKGNHAGKQVESVLVHVLSVLRKRDPLPLGEGWLEVWKFEGSRPVVLIGSTLHLEDLEYLVYFRISSKESLSLSHFSHDAAN